MRRSPLAASGAKTISSPSLRRPPRLSLAGARATGAPPATEIFFSMRSAKKPSHVPSVEKKGFDAPPVSGSTRVSSESILL
jgi:hypothetical protein